MVHKEPFEPEGIGKIFSAQGRLVQVSGSPTMFLSSMDLNAMSMLDYAFCADLQLAPGALAFPCSDGLRHVFGSLRVFLISLLSLIIFVVETQSFC